MITPQEIREKQFERAMLNGYAAASVDKFMEEVATEYAARCKEISTYRKKLKMLVAKVEEYRASEDAMRMALLQAQQTCDRMKLEAEQTAQTTVSGAHAQADALFARATEDSAAILAEAQKKHDEVIASITADANAEELRLAEARQKAALFVERMRSLCQGQLLDLDVFEAIVSGDEVEEEFVEEDAILEELITEAPVVEEPVVEAPVVEEPVVEAPVVEEPVVEEPVVEEPVVENSDPLADLWGDPIADDETDDDGDPPASLWGDPADDLLPEDGDDTEDNTKRFNFDDLKGLNFGR